MLDRGEDPLDPLLTGTPSIMLGTPDFFIERLRLLEKMGIEEVLLRIEGVPHSDIMRSLELIGREVIPVFHEQRNVYERSPVRADRGGSGVVGGEGIRRLIKR